MRSKQELSAESNSITTYEPGFSVNENIFFAVPIRKAMYGTTNKIFLALDQTES